MLSGTNPNEQPIIFGGQSNFSISYRPYEKAFPQGWLYAYCHLILGEQLLGSPSEYCTLGTWLFFLKKLKAQVIQNRLSLQNPLFDSYSDRQLIEVIKKANQLDEEFKPEYSDLPQLTIQYWNRHFVPWDETLDAYSICVFEHNGQLKFIWEGWRWPCPENEIGVLFSAIIDFESFIQTVDSCEQFLVTKYPTLSRK